MCLELVAGASPSCPVFHALRIHLFSLSLSPGFEACPLWYLFIAINDQCEIMGLFVLPNYIACLWGTE